MKISVITATYNCEKTLQTTFESIAKQTHNDLEHIVIDGGSQDNTLNLIQGWTSHALTWESGKDKGIYDALNKGIKKSSGEIIGFLHADDIYHDDKVLERISQSFEDPQIDIVYGDLVYVKKNDMSHVIRMWKSHDFNVKNLSAGWMPAHPTFYVRKKIYEQYGGFDLKYRISSDYDNMLRILRKKNPSSITYIPKILVRMRTGGVSNNSLKNIINKTLEDYSISKNNNIGGIRTVILKNLLKINQFKKNGKLFTD